MATLFSAFPAAADGEVSPQQYIDPEDAFKLSLPTNWQSSEVCLLTPCARQLLPCNASVVQQCFVGYVAVHTSVISGHVTSR
jgi:hypothetical protein